MKAKVLIPTDLSEAARTALKHAIKTAANSNLNIIHLCENQKEITASKVALEKWVSTIDGTDGINQIVRVGVFTDIPVIAKELGAQWIFTGTHGARGLQKIVGSNMLKLVSDSQIPYIIVQDESKVPTKNGYSTILTTVSHNRESKQKIKAVADLARDFESNVILLYRAESDEGYRIDTATNLVFMKRYLDKEGIEYEVEVSKGKSFNEDTIKLAKEKNADLIAIMNMQMNTIMGNSFLGQQWEQELLMNEGNIPVMIVSPSVNTASGSVTMI